MSHAIEILLADDSKHEKLFVEIIVIPEGDPGDVDASGFKHSSREVFAIMDLESGRPRIEIFSRRNSEPWRFDLEELRSILEEALRRLSG